MAYRTFSFSDDIIWRAPLAPVEHALANAVREKIAAVRPHLLDFLRLDEEAPPFALTLAEWSRPTSLSSLLSTYSDIFIAISPANRANKNPCFHCGRSGISACWCRR